MAVPAVPDYLRIAMLATCEAIIASRPPDAVIGPNADPYVLRWHLGPRGDAANAYIHIFYRDDVDRALHDHRYDNVSIILRNEYDEWFHQEPLAVLENGQYARYPIRRKEGDIVGRRADTPHRVSLINRAPCTTIFFTGMAYRKWGFATPQGWVPWAEYQERIGAEDGNYVGVDP